MNPWTPSHGREATARLLEIAAEFERAGDEQSVNFSASFAWHSSLESAKGFRAVLSGLGLDSARIKRELRWCRARAEGRVEETREGRALVRHSNKTTSEFRSYDDAEARAAACRRIGCDCHAVRITRIRRRIVRKS